VLIGSFESIRTGGFYPAIPHFPIFVIFVQVLRIGYCEVVHLLTLCDLGNFQKIENYDKTELVDINDIKIDSSQPVAKRFENYLLHIKNPYFFMCDEVPVIISFSDTEMALSSKLQDHFIRKKHL